MLRDAIREEPNAVEQEMLFLAKRSMVGKASLAALLSVRHRDKASRTNGWQLTLPTLIEATGGSPDLLAGCS